MYTIHLQQFEGPLDLLVFFIQRDELDIYDIPIARITDEYLAYVRHLQQVDLDAAGEFVFFAALLISIKAKLLLPNPELDELGEPIDPRRELVERLLEYVRFKEASGVLAELRAARQQQFTRPAGEAAPQVTTRLARLQPSDLVRGLRRVLIQVPEAVQHAVQRFVFTVEEQMEALLAVLRKRREVSFGRFTDARPRTFVIASLLAVLELVRRGQAIVRAGADVDFWVQDPGDG